MHSFSIQKEITRSKFVGTSRPDTLFFQPARMYRPSVRAGLWLVPPLVMKSEVWTEARGFKNITAEAGASAERSDKKMK
ncbi:MAG: hypothetical protein K9I47_10090 [Bacteroidales bacterium]|nr:hypothetical protein [Bacteroidales bacterium]